MIDRSMSAFTEPLAKLPAAVIDEWEHFSRTEPAASSPFLSFHFAKAVADAGVDVRATVILDQGQIAAIFPYQYNSRWGRLAGAAERIGGELSDSFGLIAQREFRIDPTDLLHLARVNYINFSHLDEVQFRHGLRGGQPRTGLRVQLVPGAERPLEAVQSVTRHYMKDSAKRERKLHDEVGTITFEFDAEENRANLLADLIDKKRAQYRSTGVTDALAATWKQSTLHRLSDCKAATCRGILSTMFAGDQWIASHFGLLGNGIFHLWFPVYNPKFSQYSPGRLLLHHMLHSCKSHGFQTIDRGEGDTARKREIANEEYRLFRGVWTNKTGASYVIHALNRVKWRLGQN